MPAPTVIDIRPIDWMDLQVILIGDTPLMVNRFAEKARNQIMDKQVGKGTKSHEKRDPDADYKAAFHRLPPKRKGGLGAPGFPASGFKGAIVYACRLFNGGPAMTQIKVCVTVAADADGLVEIHGEPHMNESFVRLPKGTTDMRYRPMWDSWWVSLKITYNADVLSRETMLALVQAAGKTGIGEWRPSAPKSATGSYGTFHIATAEERKSLGV